MPDFRAYVKRNLPLAGMPGPREAEIVEELALDLEERYEYALREGLTPEEAWSKIESQIEWHELALDFRAVLAGLFAIVAVLLTAVGAYGVLAYAVGQRRREIGVRMALGAQPAQVLAQFLGLGAKLLLAGVSIGLLGAWATGRAMQSLLFGVGSLYPGVLASTALVLIGVVLLAAYLPARRASRVSPTEALGGE